MTALHLIASEYQDAARKLADLDLDVATIADTLEGMSGDLEAKAQSVAMAVRAIGADAAALKAWAKTANERAAQLEAREEHIRRYLADTLLACGIRNVSGPGVQISFRKADSVDVFDAAQVPQAYYVTKPPPEPAISLVLVKDAIKAGQDVPGARIVTREHIQIK